MTEQEPQKALVEAPPPVKPAAMPAPVLKAQENGLLVGNSLEQQYRLANLYHKSGLMPKGLNTPEKVMVALQICHELGLPPMTSIGKIAVINGTPSLFGNLPLALVQKSGLLVAKSERIECDENGEAVKAICTMQRKGFEPETREFSIEDAKKAGLLGKDIWKQYRKRMLQMRARGWTINDVFSDVLGGLAQAEYEFDATMDTTGRIVGVPEESLAEEFNRTYGSQEEKNQEQGTAEEGKE